MILNYAYQVYPEPSQKLQLNQWRRVCQYWYNWQLGDRFSWWSQNQSRTNACPLICHLPTLRDKPNFYNQKRLLPIHKKDLILVEHSGELLDYSAVPSQTLQDVSNRVKLAFARFIAGDKNGKRSGKPRFKSESSFKTIKVEGQAITIQRVEQKWLWISITKLKGWLRIKLHRPLPAQAKIKNALLTKKAKGWQVLFCLEDKTIPTFEPESITPTWENTLGMDAVLQGDDYLATSDGEKLPSLKPYRKVHSVLAKVQTKKNARKKGSRARRKLAKREALLHGRIARARTDHAYKTAHALVRTGKKVFVYENLNLSGLTKRNKPKSDGNDGFLPNGQSSNSGRTKSFNDAAFGQFFKVLDYIAEKAGAITKKINPAYTSQLLSYRDELVVEFADCKNREWFDPIERLYIDRDINAAINIKKLGLDILPRIKRRRGKPPIIAQSNIDNSTSKQILAVLIEYQEARILLDSKAIR